MDTVYVLLAVLLLAGLWCRAIIRVIKQFERGVVFRFGRVRTAIRGPGIGVLVPIADRLEKVNMQIITMSVPAQDGISRDNVTVAWMPSSASGSPTRAVSPWTCRIM